MIHAHHPHGLLLTATTLGSVPTFLRSRPPTYRRRPHRPFSQRPSSGAGRFYPNFQEHSFLSLLGRQSFKSCFSALSGSPHSATQFEGVGARTVKQVLTSRLAAYSLPPESALYPNKQGHAGLLNVS